MTVQRTVYPSPLEAYFVHVFQHIQMLAGVDIERYEEHLFSDTRGNLRIRVCFVDQA